MLGDKRWANTWTEVEDLGGGKFGATISVGHRVFFDKADADKPKKHKLTDNRPSHVLVQSAKCCVEVYPYYARYYDVQHEEVRLYEERWVVQRLFKEPDKWRDVGVWNPVITIEEYSEPAGDVVKVTITYDTDYGTLTVEYFQRDGNVLKRNVTFQNTSGSTETFRVLQRWAGIVGAKVNGKDFPVAEDAPFLAFHEAGQPQKKFNIAENLYSMIFNEDGSEKTDQCLQRPVSIESHAQGMKADFIYAQWTLAQDESLEIDPDTATLDNPTEDGLIQLYEASYARVNNWRQLSIGNNVSDAIHRSYVEWDVSSIPISSTIEDTVFKYQGDVHVDDSHISEMVGHRPSTSTDQEVYDEVGEGTVYADPVGFPVVAAQQTVDLGLNADNDLESQLSVGWFAIGLQCDTEGATGSSTRSAIFSENKTSPVADPNPTLYVEYSVPPVSPPTVSTQAVSDILTTTATGNGNITNTGGENCDKRGIVYDLGSHGDPGDTAPAVSDYAWFEEETDSFGTGAFTRSLTGLDEGTTYYARAYAHNSEGYSYGSQVSFRTLDLYELSLTDGLDAGDTSTAGMVASVLITDGLSQGDSLAGAGVFAAALTDGVELGDTRLLKSLLSIADGVEIGDATSLLSALSRADGVELGDATSLLGNFLATLTDGVKLGDAPSSSLLASLSLADGMKLSDAPILALAFYLTLADGVKLGDSPLLKSLLSLADSIEMGDSPSLLGAFTASLVDGVKLGDTRLLKSLLSIADGVEIGDTPLSSLLALLSLTDGAKLGDTPLSSLLASLLRADGVTLGDALSSSLSASLTLTDGVKLSDTTILTLIFSLALSDGMKLGDSNLLAKLILLAVTDGMKLGDAITSSIACYVALSEAVKAGDASNLITSLQLLDGITLSDLTWLRLIRAIRTALKLHDKTITNSLNDKTIGVSPHDKNITI